MTPIPPNISDNTASKISGSLGSEIQPSFSIRTMQQDLKTAQMASANSIPNIKSEANMPNSKLSPPPIPDKIFNGVPVSATKSKIYPDFDAPAANYEQNNKQILEEKESEQPKTEIIAGIANQIPKISKPAENAEGSNKSARNKKIILLASTITLAIVLVSTGIYFSLPYIKKVLNSNQPAAENSAPPVEEPIDNPKIITNKFKLLEFSNEYDFNVLSSLYIDQFKTNIKSALLDKINSKDIVIPETGFLSIQMSVDGKFLEGEDVIDGLARNFPPAVLDKIDRKNSLLLHSQNKQPRICLAFQLLSNEDLTVWLRQWESTIAEDLKNLFMDNLGEGISTAGTFQDTIYKEIPIRYLNLSSHSAAIDYAIVDNMLIITTSRDSMFNLIDYVQNKT